MQLVSRFMVWLMALVMANVVVAWCARLVSRARARVVAYVAVVRFAVGPVPSMRPGKLSGGFGVGAIITFVIGAVIIGKVAVALWPTFVGTDTDIQALTQTDAGTTTLQAMWPILIIVGGIGIAAAVVMWGLRKLGVIKF